MLPYLKRDMETILKGITEREKEIILKCDLLYTLSNDDQVICMLSTEITLNTAPSSPKFKDHPKPHYHFVRAANNQFSLFQGGVPKTNPKKEILIRPQLTLVFHHPET